MLSRARTRSGERLPYSGASPIALTEVSGVRGRPPPSELGGPTARTWSPQGSVVRAIGLVAGRLLPTLRWGEAASVKEGENVVSR